jgi:hypothetical protein
LPSNKGGQFVYKTSADIRPTDSRTGRPVILVGPDSRPLPTDSTGAYIGLDSSPIPTNIHHEYIGVDGSPLPISDQGIVVVSPDASLITAKTLPTDRISKIIHPVVDENGLRPTDESGLYLDVNGSPLEVDDFGRPHYPDGDLLEQDADGNYFYEDKR